MSKFVVSASPHIATPRSTRSIMLDVIIALLPAVIASGVIFGWRSLVVIAVCVVAAVVSEFLFNAVCKREQTVGDLSAVVTGMLLALNLSSNMPLWQGALGSVMAVVVVKCLFGGIGKNFANPAIVARIFLLISFGDTMTEAVFPVWQKAVDSITHATGLASGVTLDAVTGATPLSILNGAAGEVPSYLDLFLGNHGGSMGETCALALLLGGIYLLCRKVITWHTPVVFIGTVFVFSLILGQDALAQILSGGLFIGAFFMATDYVTTPNTNWGKVIFGLGCGLITVLIRVYGSYPDGVSFAILLMNILTPYIDKWTKTRPLGGVKA